MQKQELKLDNTILSGFFLLYMDDNYKQICRSFKKDKKMKHALTEDIYQEGILKVAESINRNGIQWTKPELSGQTFKNYLFISLKNLIQKESIIKSRFAQDEIYQTDEDFERLDEMFYDVDESLDNQFNRIDEDILIAEIFRFIEGKYKPIHVGFFKFYFKTQYSYRQIAILTGYGVDTVFINVKAIKEDVIKHFEDRRLPHRIKMNDEIE